MASKHATFQWDDPLLLEQQLSAELTFVLCKSDLCEFKRDLVKSALIVE